MNKKSISAILIASLALTSCFKQEALNSECDIEKAYVQMDYPLQIFPTENDTLVNTDISNNIIQFNALSDADLSAVAVHFKTTPGAQVYPPSGTVRNFNDTTHMYIVKSQDEQYTRNYYVRFLRAEALATTDTIIRYNFDTFFLNETGGDPNKYYVWSDKRADGTLLYNWSSGNQGYMLSCGSAQPLEYPTVPASEAGHESCVKLETRSTGNFGQMANMPIAAGNIFLGEFDIQQALIANSQGIKGVLATKFGQTFLYRPVSFRGSYRYKRGATMTDEHNNVISGQDYGSIYAVFYENHDANNNAFVLHGDDCLTSSQIVALANLGDIDATDQWTEFNIPFQLLPGKTIEKKKLRNRGYSLAIVASSSCNGGSYRGAVGSTLYIDDFAIEGSPNP